LLGQQLKGLLSPQLVLSVGFEAMASPTAEMNSNSKIGLGSIGFVGEAAAHFLRSTSTKGTREQKYSK
jgi:hypothetical protein